MQHYKSEKQKKKQYATIYIRKCCVYCVYVLGVKEMRTVAFLEPPYLIGKESM